MKLHMHKHYDISYGILGIVDFKNSCLVCARILSIMWTSTQYDIKPEYLPLPHLVTSKMSNAAVGPLLVNILLGD